MNPIEYAVGHIEKVLSERRSRKVRGIIEDQRRIYDKTEIPEEKKTEGFKKTVEFLDKRTFDGLLEAKDMGSTHDVIRNGIRESVLKKYKTKPTNDEIDLALRIIVTNSEYGEEMRKFYDDILS